MLYFKNLKSQNSNLGEGLEDIDNNMANVSSQLDYLKDKLSDLGSSEQVAPLISDFEQLLALVSQLSSADVSGIEKGLVSVNSLLNDFYNKISLLSSNNGLKPIIEDTNKLKNVMNETLNSFQVSTITNQVNQLTLSLDTIIQKGNEVGKSLKEIKINDLDMDTSLRKNMDSVDKFVDNYKSKVNELKQLSTNILSIDKNSTEQEYATALSSIKQKVVEVVKDINSEINIAETIKYELSNAGMEVQGFNDIINEMKKNLNNASDIFSIDVSSLVQANDQFKLTDESIKSIVGNFSTLKGEMEVNTKNVEALNKVIQDLNTNGSDITFNTNAKDLLNDVKDVSDVVTNLMGKMNANPQDFVETFQRIKNDILELRKMEQSLTGTTVKSESSTAINNAIHSKETFSNSDFNDIKYVEQFGKQFIEMFKEYGNTYKDEINQLENSLKDLRSQRKSMTSSQHEIKSEGFKSIIDSVGNPDDELSRMIQFQLLGKNLTGNYNKQHVGVKDLVGNINSAGRNAFDIEDASRDLDLKVNSSLSGLKKSDKKNIEKTLGMSTDQIVEHSQEIQRMVFEFNKSKETLVKSIGEAIRNGNKDDIQNAKQDLQDLLDFGQKIASKSEIMGSSLKINDKEKFNKLPDEAKKLVSEIQKSVKNSKDLTSESIKLGNAFNVNVDNIKQMNSQLIGVDTQLNSINSSAEKATNIFSNLKNNFVTKSISGAAKGLTSAAALMGVGGLSVKQLIGNSANYYKDIGYMDVDTFSTDMMLGRDFSKSDARDKSYTNALKYYDMSGGLIDFDDYQKMYSGLVKSVGGQNGISGDQAAKDLDLITDQTIGLSKVYGISDSTVQEATKLFYRDFKMSAQDTADTINEMVQVARTANVPIDKYISQITQMAESYKNVGLSGKDASNVMNKLLIDGMNQDAAASLSQGVGSAVGNFSTNTNMMAYYGMLSGNFSNPFSAIRFGLDKYDPQTGEVRDGYGQQMAEIMDSQLGLMSSITGGDEDMKFWNVYNQFKNVYGMNDKQASIATSKYVSGDKEGFTQYLEEYSENENIVKLQGQEEIEQTLKNMEGNLAVTTQLENELKETAFRAVSVIENLSETFISPFEVAIDEFGEGIDKFVGSINGIVDLVGGTAKGDGFNPMTILTAALGGSLLLNSGPMLLNGGSSLIKKISGGSSRSAARAVDSMDGVSDILKHGDDISSASKLLKKGGKYAAIAALTGGGLVALNSKLGGNPNPDTEYTDWIGVGAQDNLAYSATNAIASAGLEGITSNVLNKVLSKTIGSSLGKLSYGVGDAIFAVGDVMQHQAQGDYMSEDVGKNAVNFGINAGGSVAGAAIGSLAGPLGTVIGGVLGAFTVDILNLVKLENGKGLGSTISDGAMHAVTGYTSEELEYKRSMINNPQEMLKHRLEMSGISKEQSGTISQAMLDHSDKLEGLTEEQIDAWAKLYSQMETLGKSNEEIIKELTSIFSSDNLNQVLANLGINISESVTNGLKEAFPNGMSTQDVIELEKTKQNAEKEIIQKKLGDYGFLTSNISPKGGLTREEANKFVNDIYENHQVFYDALNDPSSKYYETAIDFNKKLQKDVDKNVDKVVDQKYKEQEQEKVNAQIKQNNLNEGLKSSLQNAFMNDDDALIKAMKERSNDYAGKMKIADKNSLDYERFEMEKNIADNGVKYLEAKKQAEKEALSLWNEEAAKEKETAIKKGKLDKYDPNKINQFDLNPFNEKTKDDYIDKYINNSLIKSGFSGAFVNDVIPSQAKYASESVFAELKDGKNNEVLGKYGNNVDNVVKTLKDQDKTTQTGVTKQLKEQMDTNEKLLSGNVLREKMKEDMKTQIDETILTNSKLDSTNKLLEQNLAKIGNSSTISTSSGYVALSGDISSIDTKSNMLNFSGEYGSMNEKGASEKINQLFKGTALEGMGSTYVKYGKQNGVDPYLMASISMQETGGNSDMLVKSNNVGGLRGSKYEDSKHNGTSFSAYDSLDKGISELARVLKDVYYSNGKTTIEQIQKDYAPLSDSSLNTHWVGGVSNFYSQLTGKTNSPIDNVTMSDPSSYAQQTINNTQSTNVGTAMAMIAAKQVGSNYIWGAEGSADWDKDGDSRNGFDCSGLVSYAANMAGAKIGRLTADGLWKSGKVKQISKSELQTGDLGFRDDGGKMGHVGIYDGNGGWIHAANENSGVVHDKSSQWTHYGRLDGSNSETSVDWNNILTSSTGGSTLVGGSSEMSSGSGSSTSSSSSFEEQLANTSAFNKGGMLYDFVPSNYSSYFSRDPSVTSNYPQAITDMYKASGGSGITIPDSQAISRALRQQMDSSWTTKDDPYAETISDISKYQSQYESQNTKAKAAIDVNIISPDNLNSIELKLIDHIKNFKLDDSSLDIAINEYLGPIIEAIQDVSGGLDRTNKNIYESSY